MDLQSICRGKTFQSTENLAHESKEADASAIPIEKVSYGGYHTIGESPSSPLPAANVACSFEGHVTFVELDWDGSTSTTLDRLLETPRNLCRGSAIPQIQWVRVATPLAFAGSAHTIFANAHRGHARDSGHQGHIDS